MIITAQARSPLEIQSDLLVLAFTAGEGSPKLSGRAAAADRALDGAIQRVIDTGDFRAKAGQTLVLYPGEALPAKRVLLLGLGKDADLDAEAVRSAGGTIVREAGSRRAAKVAVALPPLRKVRPPAAGQALAEGAVLASYRFDDYKEKPKDAPVDVAAIQVCFERLPDARAVQRSVRRGVTLAESQNVARDLSNMPGNALPPAQLAREAQKVAKEAGLSCKVMAVPELRKRKMGAILAVGEGSANPPRMVVMEHKPARPRGKTICFVGKGVTFDSGGISIKPAAGMDEMKHDMSGAAAVVGAMRACGLLKVPYHVVGIIGAAENMPSGTAYRPGDIVTSASGKTIEILNTDAEGRVVLADALHHAVEEYSPGAIIDLATLTGACVVSLGRWATGLFGNNDKLVELVRRAGEETAERAWPMPLWEEHRKAVKSDVADVKNTGAGREAGSSTAAAFLAAFVGGTPWVHLDIAGTGWMARGPSYQPKGATGVGVRLLLELLDGWKGGKLD